MKKFKNLFLGVIVAFLFFATSCNEVVEPGYVGMVQTPSGMKEEVLQPGHHTCYGRDRIILIEQAETNFKSHMSVLCADELNFNFDVNVLSRLRNEATSGKQIANIIKRQGGKIKWVKHTKGILGFKNLYLTYISPDVDAICRSVVSKYKTTDIRANRDKIAKELNVELIKLSKKTPIDIIKIVPSNFDYPDVITQAQEKSKELEIKLKQVEAQQAIDLKEISNRKAIAKQEKVVKALEAEAEAIYVRILGGALTKNYLKLKGLQNQNALFKNSNKNTIIVPSGSTPFVGASPDMR